MENQYHFANIKRNVKFVQDTETCQGSKSKWHIIVIVRGVTWHHNASRLWDSLRVTGGCKGSGTVTVPQHCLVVLCVQTRCACCTGVVLRDFSLQLCYFTVWGGN